MMRSLAILIAAIVLGYSPSEAQPVSGACRLFGAEAADESRGFWELSPLTGVGSFIGDPGQAVTGLAFHPFTGVLYGATAVISVESPTASTIAPGHLITIDPTTGVGVDVGSFGLANLSNEGNTLADLTFDPTTGILYGWRARSEGDLYTVNLLTGAATLVGESGLSGLTGGGLAFGPQGKLFLAAEGTSGLLRTIDKTTGLPIDSVSLSGYSGNESIAALAYDGGGLLYGVTRKAGDLIRIDPTTGVIDTVGPAADVEAAIDALAFDRSCVPAAAPALSLPVLLGLSVALLTLGARLRTRSVRRRLL